MHTCGLRISGCAKLQERLVLGIAAAPVTFYGERVGMQSKRILVVDDFAAWRPFLETLLMVTPEWQVSGEAVNGAEALSRARELQPDLVLLDIDLPDLNGIEVARQLQIVVPNVKIVFLTAESSQQVVNAALSTGASGYLLKSQVVGELLPALKSVFSGNRFTGKGITFHEPTK
jgi:DNA-binding NarL/FixJ family response regulator